MGEASVDDGFEIVDSQPIRIRVPKDRTTESLEALLNAGIEVDWLGDDDEGYDRVEIELPSSADLDVVRGICRDLDDRF